MIGHHRMAELTHAMESVFGTVRDGKLVPTSEIVDVLQKIITDYFTEIGVGEIHKLSARLFARNVYRGVDTAIFYLNLEAGSSKRFPDSSSKLTGLDAASSPSGAPSPSGSPRCMASQVRARYIAPVSR